MQNQQNLVVCHSCMHRYFVLTRTVETLFKTNSAIFTSLLDTCSICQHSTFSLLMSQED